MKVGEAIDAQANRPGKGSIWPTFIGLPPEVVEQVAHQTNGIFEGVHQRINDRFVLVLLLDHFSQLVFDFSMQLVVDVKLRAEVS